MSTPQNICQLEYNVNFCQHIRSSTCCRDMSLPRGELDTCSSWGIQCVIVVFRDYLESEKAASIHSAKPYKMVRK